MSDLDLVFSQPQYTGGPLDLVFGAGAGAPVVLPIEVTITVTLSAPVVTCTVLYDNRLPATVAAIASAPHQDAASAEAPGRAPWGRTEPMDAAPPAAWQSADRAAGAPRTPWALTQSRSDGSTRTRWGAARVISEAMAAAYEESTRLERFGATRWQTADARSVGARAPHQVATSADLALVVRLQQALASGRAIYSPHQVASEATRLLRTRWQDARHVPTGITVWVPGGGGGLTPHVPSLDLVFACPAYVQGEPVNLVFGRVCGNDPLPALIVVPIRGVYMTINSLALTRVSDGATLPAKAFGMQLGADAWTWSWSATLSGSALDLLAPGSGNPVELQATINGVAYRLFAESISRTRRFGEHSLAVSGRGLGAVLDAPYALSLSFGAASSRTAQQLAGEALQINGVDIGWDVDWGLEDWLVPGGVWSHQGSHISAVNAIAAAAGGYVQPHATASTLRVLPRYPVAPWDWAGVTPDIELPSAPVVVEGIQWQSKAAYNRVFVRSQGGSFAGDVKRTGTMGEVDAPMVVDQLITAAAAARQRGLAVLGDTGQQAAVSLSLPVLAETGLILPGKFVRYVDGATERLGLVRSTSLAWEQPKLRQTITLETHI